MLNVHNNLLKGGANWNNNLKLALKSFEVQGEYCHLNLKILQIRFVQLQVNLQ